MGDQSPIAIETLRSGFNRALAVGARVFVNFHPGQIMPARTRLRGWAEGRFLLLDDLGAHDATIEYRPGATWMLKYVAAGFVCVAQTAYIERTTPSMGAVYVSFPREIHVHSLRLHKRIAMRHPARYVYHRPDGTLPDTMTGTTLADLSAGGCAIWVEEYVERDTRLAVAIAPTPDEDAVVFAGSVRRCTPGMGGHTVGLEFDPVDNEQVQVLQRILGEAFEHPDLLTENE